MSGQTPKRTESTDERTHDEAGSKVTLTLRGTFREAATAESLEQVEEILFELSNRWELGAFRLDSIGSEVRGDFVSEEPDTDAQRDGKSE